MVFRPRLEECSIDGLVDSLDEEALDHLLGIDGSASEPLCPEFLRVVSHRQNMLSKGSNVDLDCRYDIVRRKSI